MSLISVTAFNYFTAQGDTWSLPYSLGPPHMEKDKNESNVACFDCCYHPAAIRQMDINKRFRDSLVITAIEGVEEAYKRQKQDVSSKYMGLIFFLIDHCYS